MTLDARDRDTLERWVRSRTLPVRVVARTQIVLALASGLTVAETARRLKTSPITVRLWRRRYQDLGPDGLLRDRPGRGRKSHGDPTARHARLAVAGSAGSKFVCGDESGGRL